MPTVFIPPQMRDLTGGVAEVAVEGCTLRQAIAALNAKHPGLAARLQDGDRLVSGLAVSVDGTVSSQGLLTKIAPTSEVHFLPAIGGG